MYERAVLERGAALNVHAGLDLFESRRAAFCVGFNARSRFTERTQEVALGHEAMFRYFIHTDAPATYTFSTDPSEEVSLAQNPSHFGTPPAGPAPPAGSPPPAAPATPTQEDRLLAAAGYLGYFTGFWLVVPIVIYVVKRDKSRFVAHHAMRAVVLHLVAVPVFLLSWMLAFGLSIGLAASFQGGPRKEPSLAEALFPLLWLLGWILPWLVYLVACGIAALRAFQGRVVTTSLFGRFVERLLGQDTSVAHAG